MKRSVRPVNYNLLGCIAIFCGAISRYSFAEEFNSSFLVGEAASVDWSNADKMMSPGVYDLDIDINGKWQGKFSVKIDDDGSIRIERDSVPALGIIVEKMPGEESETVSDWIMLSSLLHGGEYQLKSAELRVNLTVPQAYVIKSERNWVAPKLWDQGINGLYSNYNMSYFRSSRSDGFSDTENLYLMLNSGLNVSGWNLIDKSFYRSNAGSGKWINNQRYLERALPSLRASIQIGDTLTGSPWFDSIRFRGVTLQQEARMYPDSYRTYMPVIRGIATTNAAVRVFQNGNIIYQMNVPPGPFEIRDLMPTGSRSDMTVVIENAGGVRETQTVPYSTVSDMLRESTSEWLVNVGKVAIRNIDYAPEFIQGNYSYGINNYLTLYGGMTLSDNYTSLLVGSAFSIPYLGSVSASVDSARAKRADNETRHGERYKIAWSRYFPTRTNLTLAAYYYNTQQYMSFYDLISVNNALNAGNDASQYANSKQTYSVDLSQTLPDGLGKISLTGYWRSYWNSTKENNQYALTWSNNYRGVGWSISANRVQYVYDANSVQYSETNYGQQRNENRLDFTMTIPFSLFDRNVNINMALGAVDNKYTTARTSISGATPLVDYNIAFSDDNTNKYRSAGAYAGWKTPYSKLTGSVTGAANYTQYGAGASGSVVLWRGGILASPNTGNTFVILDAPGTEGATVNNNASMRTNHRGQVLVPSATAYRMNNFRLDDGDTTDDSAELKGNIGYIAPWKGSISYIKYQTDTRKVFVLHALKENGGALPFGIMVYDESGEETGYVAQGSQIYIKAEKLPASLYINTLDDSRNKQRCQIVRPATDGDNICQSVR